MDLVSHAITKPNSFVLSFELSLDPSDGVCMKSVEKLVILSIIYLPLSFIGSVCEFMEFSICVIQIQYRELF